MSNMFSGCSLIKKLKTVNDRGIRHPKKSKIFG